MPEPRHLWQLDAHTQLTGVLGYPVRHSLSPAMHNAAFRALGLNWVYLAFEIPPEALPQAIVGMRGLRIQGLNLTIPHKEAVIPLLDALTDAAQRIRAVNTLFWEGGRLVGDNTDAEGFLQALREAGIEPAGQTVLILGAGGAARAVAYALHQQGCALMHCEPHSRTCHGARAGVPSNANRDDPGHATLPNPTIGWCSELHLAGDVTRPRLQPTDRLGGAPRHRVGM
ncbi:MAG: hypothetical protein KatS3mg016_0169 [Fimbriimonadales bacterium]|nr:MAG: hypothetical protein KatS3mg016_0169 [Fimbriimonadales bacterium]